MARFSLFTSLFRIKNRTTMDIDQFLKTNIVDLAGLSGAPEDVKRDFLAKASELVLTAIVDRIDSELDESKKEEFYRIFREGAKNEDMQAFLKANVPNFEEIVGEETGRVKVALVKAAQELNKSSV